MSRKPRIWFPGAIYHITARGNRRSSLFYDQHDCWVYLKRLEETRKKFPFILHSYCLMTNHIHLIIETTHNHPKEIMRTLHSEYAIYFNRRHDFDGHVFQGRYGSELIDSLRYLLDASKYVHLNPIKAKIVTHPKHYYWSSYPSFISNKPNSLISTEKILSQFPEPAKGMYQQFVERGLTPNQLKH